MKPRLLFAVLALGLVALPSRAEDIEGALRNDVQLTMVGVNPLNGNLVLEGTSLGEMGSGTLTVEVGIISMTEDMCLIVANWTRALYDGEVVTGVNFGHVNLHSLSLIENGVVLTGTGAYQAQVGHKFRVRGSVNNLYFLPGITQVTGTGFLLPSLASDDE